MSAGGRAPMVITHEGGVKFAAQVRSHRILLDQPARAGGDDAGPAPIELLGVSLGACVALYVQQFCAARAMRTEGMRVEVEQRGAQNPNRVGEFVVRVLLPGEIPPQYAGMLERAARSCPAHNTLAHGAAVDVRVDAAVSLAAPAPTA